jgi:hypothetical protein
LEYNKTMEAEESTQGLRRHHPASALPKAIVAEQILSPDVRRRRDRLDASQKYPKMERNKDDEDLQDR